MQNQTDFAGFAPLEPGQDLAMMRQPCRGGFPSHFVLGTS
jgi:hypothetical protein